MTDQHDSPTLSQTHLLVRLNKYLSQRGVAARRKADDLILAGRVSVNGAVVRVLGSKINPATDVIRVDSQVVTPQQTRVIYKIYKPVGVVSTMHDEQGRASLQDLVPPSPLVFPVGRLDRFSEGLLIMTNDGEIALRLSHPRYRQRKTYRVWVHKPQSYVLSKLIEALQYPRDIGGKRRSFETVEYGGVDATGIIFDVSLREGIYHEVKRLVDRAGLTVARLVRIQQGPIELGTLKPGECCRVSAEEYRALQRLVE